MDSQKARPSSGTVWLIRSRLRFAAAGAATVLFPLPDHFCRNIFYNMNSYAVDPFVLPSGREMNLKLFTSIMKEELLANPDRFIRFNRQLMGELGKLVDLVRDPTFGNTVSRTFFDSRVSPTASISLIGYSLGGLCALQAFLLKPERFRSCILLNSGASFQDMDGADMFGKKEWRQHQLTLTSAAREAARSEALPDYFDHVMLGNSRKELQNLLEMYSHRIFVLVGGKDHIVNFKTLANLEPQESGLAIIQIPGLDHHINIAKRAGSVWLKWQQFAAEAIMSFDSNHPTEQHPATEEPRRLDV